MATGGDGGDGDDGKGRANVIEADYYETASILSEVFDAHTMVANSLAKELDDCQREFHFARLAVFQQLREASGGGEGGEGGKSSNSTGVDAVPGGGAGKSNRLPTTNQGLWIRLSQIASRAVSDVTGEDMAGASGENREQVLCRRVGDALLYDTYERAVALLSDHAARTEGVRSEIASLCQGEDQSRRQRPRPQQQRQGEREETKKPAEATVGAADATVHGWAHSDHILFAKAWRENVDRGKGHGAFRKQLALLLPHVSRGDITAHAHWFERHRFLQRQLREERARWERTCADTLRHAGEAFRDAARKSASAERTQAAWSKTKESQSVLHNKLAKMREVFESRRAEKQARELARAREAKAALEKERQASDARRARERAEIEGFRGERRAAAQRAADKREVARAAEEQRRLEEAPLHAERVQHRKQVLVARERARAATLAARERDRQEALGALERLKQQCAYFEKIKDIAEHQDPNHHVQVTRAYDLAVKELAALRAAHAGLLTDHDRGPGRGLDGFDSKRVVGDIRFKLVEQLRTAGLQSTPYAQAMIINMSRQIRPNPGMMVSATAPWGPRVVTGAAKAFGVGF